MGSSSFDAKDVDPGRVLLICSDIFFLLLSVQLGSAAALEACSVSSPGFGRSPLDTHDKEFGLTLGSAC